jgi:hypothetical protein
LQGKKCKKFNFLITDDRDFRPQTCTNGLVFRECKHIKNIFEDVYFTKNSFHTTLTITGRGINLSSFALIDRLRPRNSECIASTIGSEKFQKILWILFWGDNLKS